MKTKKAERTVSLFICVVVGLCDNVTGGVTRSVSSDMVLKNAAAAKVHLISLHIYTKQMTTKQDDFFLIFGGEKRLLCSSCYIFMLTLM